MTAACLLILLLSLSPVLAANELRVVTEEYPPYQTVVDGRLVSGTSFNLVKELLRRADFNSRIELLPWARAYAVATAQANVVIFSIARSAEREAYFHWLYKLEGLSYHFYALAARKDLQTSNLTDISRSTVVAVRNSFEAASLMELGFIENKNLILTLNYKDAWQMLMLGRADFTYANQLIEGVIEGTPDDNSPLFTKSFNIGETSDLYVAASINTDKAILKKLQASLSAMQHDGTIKKFQQPRLLTKGNE